MLAAGLDPCCSTRITPACVVLIPARCPMRDRCRGVEHGERSVVRLLNPVTTAKSGAHVSDSAKALRSYARLEAYDSPRVDCGGAATGTTPLDHAPARCPTLDALVCLACLDGLGIHASAWKLLDRVHVAVRCTMLSGPGVGVVQGDPRSRHRVACQADCYARDAGPVDDGPSAIPVRGGEVGA